MKRRQTHLGTTPSGKKVYLDKLPHQYPGFSAEDHSYAAVLHEANRTPGGVADLHRTAADAKFRSLRRASGRIGGRGKLPDRYDVVETIDGDWMILIDGIQTGSARDRSGAGSDTYPTYDAAYKAALRLAYPSESRTSHATRASAPRDWTARQMTSGRRVVEKARGNKIARIFQGEGYWTVTLSHREPRAPFETTGEITRQSAKTLAAAKGLGTRLLKGS